MEPHVDLSCSRWRTPVSSSWWTRRRPPTPSSGAVMRTTPRNPSSPASLTRDRVASGKKTQVRYTQLISDPVVFLLFIVVTIFSFNFPHIFIFILGQIKFECCEWKIYWELQSDVHVMYTACVYSFGKFYCIINISFTVWMRDVFFFCEKQCLSWCSIRMEMLID